jgi:hypothetical protein
MKFWTKTRALMLLAILALLAFKTISCDGGGSGCDSGGLGCDGMNNLEWGQYPEDDKIKNIAQLRVTQPGFEFISNYAVPLIETLMGGPLSFPIEEQSFLTCSVCEGGCTGNNAISINIASVEVRPVFPDMIEVDINLPANFEVKLPIDCWPGIGCDARLHTNGQPVTITTRIFVDTDNDTGLLDLRVDTPIVPYDKLYASVCGIGSNISNALIGLFQNLIRDYIKGMLTDIVEGFKCVSCEEKPCPAHPVGYDTYCVEGICRIGLSALDECMLQPLGIEAAFDVGSLLSGFLPGVESNIWVSALAGGQTQVIDNGLEIGLFGGTMVPPDAPEPCTGFVEFPGNGTTLSRVPIGNMNEHYQPPIPFHAGIAIREDTLDQAGYTLVNSGLLCLELNEETPTIGQYVGPATFGLLLPDLTLYTHNENPPWILALEPGPPIDFKILDHDAAYPYDPENPEASDNNAETALKIIIKDLKLNFYSLVEDRQVRLFTLEIDVEVTAGLELMGAEITPVLDANSIKLINYRIPFSAVGTPPAEAAAKFDAFISGLLGTLLGDALSGIGGFEIPGFDLTDDGVEDMFIDIQSIMPEIPKGGGEYSALYVYAGLRFASGAAPTPAFRAETRADIIDQHLPMPENFLDENDQPTLVLALSGTDAEGGDGHLEYQYSMDGSNIWSSFTRKNVLTITDNRLLLQGRHEIAVRARDTRYSYSVDETPEIFSFISDFTRPNLRLMRVGDTGVRFEGRDNLSSADTLEYRMRLNNGEWTEWSANDTLDLAQQTEFPLTVTVEVSDEIGLTTTISRTFNDSIIDDSELIDLTAPGAAQIGDPEAAGCSSSASGSLWLLALLGLPLLMWRRGALKAMPVLLVLGGFSLSLLAIGCGGDSIGQSCLRNEDCPPGQWCNNNICEDAQDGDVPDADIDLPEDGDEPDGDLVDGDKPDGDVVDGDEDVVYTCDGQDCPPCYYCAQRTKECKPQPCDPACENLLDCPTSTGDTCSACVVADDDQDANACTVPRCSTDADCGCRDCGVGEVVYCQKDTGVCACAAPCQCGENQACCLTEENPAGTCENCPGWCEGVQCEPGFSPGSCDPTNDPDCIWADLWSPCSNYNDATCEFEGVGMPNHEPSCGCQENPPLPLAFHGRYSELAVHNNENIWISAYSQSYGDLMIGRAKATKLFQGIDDIYWEFIDGVPWGEQPTAGPSGPRRGISKPGVDVGKFTSLALSADGWPLVAYQDVDNGDLLFIYTEGEPGHPGDADGDEPDGDVEAELETVDGDSDIPPVLNVDGDTDGEEAPEFPSYKWTKIVVDSSGDTGYYTDMWLDDQGRPVIAYMMKSNDEGTQSALKLAMATTSTPMGPEDFVIVTVDTAAIGQKYCEDPEACPDYDDIPYGVGINPSMVRFPNGEFWVLYYHYTTYGQTQVTDSDGNPKTVTTNVLQGNLKRAVLASLPDPATLATATFAKSNFLGTAGTLVDGNVGVFHSAFVFQTNGWYAMTFYNKTLNQLQIAFDFGQGLKLATLDDGWRRDNNGDYFQIKVGADCNMTIDMGGMVRVLYQDQTFDKLMYIETSFDGQGPVGTLSQAALLEMVDGLDRDGNAMEYGQAFGFYPSIALVNGNIGIYSSYVVDVTNPSQKKKIMELRLGTTTFVR